MIACSKCGAMIETSRRTCLKCGTVDPNTSIPGTMHLRGDANELRSRRTHQQETRSGLPDWSVHLQIRGLSERLKFVESTEVILGRSDLVSERETYIDLGRYGGRQRGVSRQHAVLRFATGQVMLTDLNSLNGTSINFNKLEPNRPYLLHSGDRIMVGALSIVIEFNINQLGPATK
jgi:hypothetical protein